jgi:hypothetical protein
VFQDFVTSGLLIAKFWHLGFAGYAPRAGAFIVALAVVTIKKKKKKKKKKDEAISYP